MNSSHTNNRRRPRRLRHLVGLILGSLLIAAYAPGLAGASAPQSFSEATEQGDPAASAPVISTPEIYTLEGNNISADQVLAEELNCLQSATSYTCFRSDAEAEAAAGASVSKAKRNGATMSKECGGGISLMYMNQWPNYGGAVTTLGLFNAWYDLGATLNNNTSSFKMGEGNGHLSEDTGGFGFWYPGNTSECALQPDLNGTGWNNRISSRYRYH